MQKTVKNGLSPRSKNEHTQIDASHKTRRAARWTAALSASLVVAASTGLTAPSAMADTGTTSGPTTITGTVMCINSVPVGAWINGQQSTSGWATLTPIYEAGANTKLQYSYTLDSGGSYSIAVGCGGTPQDWGLSAATPLSDSSDVNWVCNDISGPLARLGNWALRRVLGFGPDLTEGVPYGQCVAR